MRLIDADILKEAFIVNTDRNGYLMADPEVLIDNAPTVEEKSYAMGYQDGLEDGLNDIRPKGKWELHGKTYYCSECGEEAIDLEPEPDVYSSSYCLTDYCPYCGADMRGEEQ